ncbi:hypothetical protein VKT23_016360 [Stygiomarasmius scandens]|uniref:Uncharacterized protein n=1 Tax=Marasmiellus scandens TaxID=2682957 RepID=A0ABR1IYQ6_9AGAR
MYRRTARPAHISPPSPAFTGSDSEKQPHFTNRLMFSITNRILAHPRIRRLCSRVYYLYSTFVFILLGTFVHYNKPQEQKLPEYDRSRVESIRDLRTGGQDWCKVWLYEAQPEQATPRELGED